MKLTDIYKLKLFERTDPVDMETVNENFKSVEKIFDGLTAEDVGAVATKGDTADNTVAFTTASERTKISSGETHATLFGKIARWLTDLKTVAFTGSYKDLSDKPSIPSAVAVKGNAETNYRTGKVNLTPDNIGALAKTAVVNNNTTTVAGFALDARQANPNVDGSMAKQISTLNDGLAKCLSVDGQHATYNPISDLNGFYNGIGLFTAPTLNMPGDGWYLVISSGVPGTVCQRAVNLFGGGVCHRYCASSNWSSWEVDNYLSLSGGTMSGNIYTNAGAIYPIDGNVYINSDGYKDYLSNILKSKLSASASCNKNWNWDGSKGDQPTWLWGGEDPNNVYVYNPLNFTVFRCTGGIQKTAFNLGAGLNENATIFRTYNNNGTVLDNKIQLGSGGSRFKQLFAATATISTSDRNFKDNIEPLTDIHLNFFLKLQPVSFLFKNGDSGRTHVGFIAQDVENAMAQCGLTALDFAGFCKDIKVKCTLNENGKEVEEPVLDKNGNPEYIYSLRYEEFIAIITHAVQKLWQKVTDIEHNLAKMSEK